MPDNDVKCPRCGKQSTEYAENKWECLHCDNKFVHQAGLSMHQTQAPDDEIDFGIDVTTGDDGPASDAPDLAAGDSEILELLPDAEVGDSIGDEAVLKVGSLLGDDDESDATLPLPDTDVLGDDDDLSYETFTDSDILDLDDDEPARPIREQKRRTIVILVTIGFVVVLWIASYFQGNSKDGGQPGRERDLIADSNTLVESRPNKPEQEPPQPPPEVQRPPREPPPEVQKPPKEVPREIQKVLEADFTPKQIFQRVKPSIVLIVVRDSLGEVFGQGSGFFVGEGEIISNFHVIEGAASGYVKLLDTQKGYEIDGIIAMDKERDLVVLKVPSSGVPSLPIGNSDTVEVGDPIYAVGNPKGLEGTFSRGDISGLRDDKYLQITAPISSGSSGCPVLNKKGEVIGVAKGGISAGQNLNFAIPSKYIKPLLDQSGDLMPFSSAGIRTRDE